MAKTFVPPTLIVTELAPPLATKLLPVPIVLRIAGLAPAVTLPTLIVPVLVKAKLESVRAEVPVLAASMMPPAAAVVVWEVPLPKVTLPLNFAPALIVTAPTLARLLLALRVPLTVRAPKNPLLLPLTVSVLPLPLWTMELPLAPAKAPEKVPESTVSAVVLPRLTAPPPFKVVMVPVPPLRFTVPLFTVVNLPTPPTVTVPVSNVPIVAALTTLVLPAPVSEVIVVVPVAALKFRLLAVAFELLTAPSVCPPLAKTAEPLAPRVNAFPENRLLPLDTLKVPPFTVVRPL